MGKALNDTDRKKVITRYVRNDLGLRIIEFFFSSGKDVAQASEVATALKEDVPRVKKMLAELHGRGVLKSMGSGMFNFVADAELKDKLHVILEQWKDPARHGEIQTIFQETDGVQKKGFWARLFGK